MYMVQGDRLEDDWRPHEDTRTAEEIEEETRRAEAQNKVCVCVFQSALQSIQTGDSPVCVRVCVCLHACLHTCVALSL